MPSFKSYDAPEINIKEVIRYTGDKNPGEEFLSLVKSTAEEYSGIFEYKISYSIVDIKLDDDFIDFGFTRAKSHSLSKCLSGCNKAVIFAATVGLEIDRCIRKFSSLSPTKSLILQAFGSERAEALCDTFENEIKEKFGHTKPRFSPGYGDLSLEIQKDIIKLLDCGRTIGVTLNESLLMSPSKSVTAIIGIAEETK